MASRNDDERVGAAVQARMGSTRLPGKVLRAIGQRPMIQHIYRRVQSAETVDEVIVATTTNPEDEELSDFCGEHDIPVYRGAERDLLSRLHGAARSLDVGTIARIYGDCPCIMPSMIDDAVTTLSNEDLDYVSTFHGDRTFPHGTDFEVYRTATLERILRDTSEAYYRQYIHEYLEENEGTFRTSSLEFHRDVSDLSVAVDYPRDLEVVRELFRALDDADGFDLEDLLAALERRPELAEATAGLERNAEFKDRKRRREQDPPE